MRVGQGRYPFAVVNRSGHFGFALPADKGQLDSPERVGSLVLRHLKQSAERHLGTSIR
jgi:molecular chaperone DnaK (HSP70)